MVIPFEVIDAVIVRLEGIRASEADLMARVAAGLGVPDWVEGAAPGRPCRGGMTPPTCFRRYRRRGPGSVSPDQPTLEGLWRKPVEFQSGTDYVPLLVGANRRAAGAPSGVCCAATAAAAHGLCCPSAAGCSSA